MDLRGRQRKIKILMIISNNIIPLDFNIVCILENARYTGNHVVQCILTQADEYCDDAGGSEDHPDQAGASHADN